MRYLILVVLLTGCASEFKGGATSDHRMAPQRIETEIKDGGVKTNCHVTKVKRQGDVIHLDC